MILPAKMNFKGEITFYMQFAIKLDNIEFLQQDKLDGINHIAKLIKI